MYWDHHRDLAGLRPDDLIDALAARPATWLRPFLQLAASRADPPAARGPEGSWHWYRLSAPDAAGASRFLWRPHGHPRLFTAFDGAIVAAPAGDGSVLHVCGETSGGIEEINRVAIGTVATLLASAMASDQVDG
jgi:hypothetical protein